MTRAWENRALAAEWSNYQLRQRVKELEKLTGADASWPLSIPMRCALADMCREAGYTLTPIVEGSGVRHEREQSEARALRWRAGGAALFSLPVFVLAMSGVEGVASSLVQAALSRPHQPRNVLIDALASFEARPSLGAPLLELANELVEDELGRWIDRTLGLDEVRERERRDDRLTRLLRSLDRVGGVFRAWRRGRPPQLVDAAFDLYAILTRPRRADPEP